ncbi:HEPN domain-containing protein [Candidatus Poribacteria bacterium]|nr:HEPN domain-containing protein [Candidatus Poribacteria bacterium]
MAQEFLKASKVNLDAKHLRTSISRSYYSVYHACVALFEHYGYHIHHFLGRSGRPATRWEHGIIIKKSYSELVRRHRRLNSQDVFHINRLYRDRINADYRFDLPITESQAEESYKIASSIYQKITEAINEIPSH